MGFRRVTACSTSYSISYRTAFRHWKAGLVKGKQLPTGTIVVEEKPFLNTATSYCIYARVSSHDQKEDLIRQRKRLEDYCAAKGFIVDKTYCEIVSGINDQRRLLIEALKSRHHIVVEHKDRLTRFGFNYIEELLLLSGRKIIVINKTLCNNDLTQDFVSIVTSFCVRIYGSRRKTRKTEEFIQELKSKDSQCL